MASSLGGVGQNDPLDAATSRMKEIAASAAKIAASLSSASGSLNQMSAANFGGGGSAPNHVGGAASHQSSVATGNTGQAANNGMQLGTISEAYATGGPGGAIKQGAAEVSSVAMGVFQDLRISAPEALDFEHNRYIATVSTGADFDNFGDSLRNAMTGTNVQDAGEFTALAAMAAKDYSGLFSGSANAREQAAISMMGGAMELGAAAGISQEAAMTGLNQMQSPQGYYSMMAMGVMTRDPVTGEPLSTEEIVNQLYNNYDLGSYSREDLEKELTHGSALRVGLEQALGAEGAELAMTGMRLAHETGGPLVEGQVASAKQEAGWSDTEDTEARDALTGAEAALVDNLDTFTNDVTTAIEDVANATTGLRDIMEKIEGLLGPLMTWYGGMDTANSMFSNATPPAMNMLSQVLRMVPVFGQLLPPTLGLSEGSWNISKDQVANVHQGEMVLPSRIADAVRTEMRRGVGSSALPPSAITMDNFSSTVDSWNVESQNMMQGQQRDRMSKPPSSSGAGSKTVNVTINLSVARADDREAVAFARRVKGIIDDDTELMTIGAGRLS